MDPLAAGLLGFAAGAVLLGGESKAESSTDPFA
jgi:hypothetical protein